MALPIARVSVFIFNMFNTLLKLSGAHFDRVKNVVQTVDVIYHIFVSFL